MSEEGDKAPGLAYNRRRNRGRATNEPPGFVLKVEMERVDEEGADDDEESPRFVYNRRRHSAVGKNVDSLGSLPVFPVEKPKGRRHSLMAPSDALRRVSLDITAEQREALQLPRFSQVFGFSTFSGLPMTNYVDPVIGYENTYKMEPDKKFQPHAAKKVVEKIVDDLLDWDDDVLTDNEKQPTDPNDLRRYELAKHKRRSKLITKMVDEVKDELKELKFPRYRYVVNAFIGELKGQGVRVASRCLWDTNNDTSLCVQRSGRHGFVTVLVHAVYFE